MALGENIRQLRIGRGWSTHRLAEEISLRLGRELFQSSISRYESNEIRPRAGVLKAMADALGVELVQLEYGDQRLLTVSVGIHKVPLIDWADVQEFLNAPRRGLEVMHPFLLTHEEYSAKAFGLKIADDSMTPRFQPCDTIIIDPGITPNPNDFVVAKHADLTWFRQYKARGLRDGKPTFELVPSNDGYASIRSEDGAEILGTMVEHRTYRQK